MKNLFLFLVALSSFGCSKSGPSFEVATDDIKLFSSESGVISLKRAEPEMGPVYNLKPTNTHEISKVSKKLVCGQYTLEGRTLTAPNPSLLYFKISQTEFSQLFTLPPRASCKLVVSVENKFGAKQEKETPLKFRFDTNPPVQIVRFVARQGGFVPVDSQNQFLLERVVIKNTLNYAAGFTYFGSNYSCQTVNTFSIPLAQNPIYCSNQMPSNLASSNLIKLNGLFESLSGDMSSWVSFVVQPGDEVVIESYGKISPQSPQTPDLPNDAIAPLGPYSLSGVVFRQCADLNHAHSLALWGDFKKSKEDLTSPMLYKQTSETVLNLPEWRAQSCR